MSEQSDVQAARRQVRRALRLMNKYGLTEFEFEDKSTDRSLVIQRDDPDQSPALLEGRSSRIEADVRSPAPGRLHWDADEGQSVQSGDVVATVTKYDEEVEVQAPREGTIVDLVPEGYVAFAEYLAEIQPIPEQPDDNSGDDPEDTGSS